MGGCEADPAGDDLSTFDEIATNPAEFGNLAARHKLFGNRRSLSEEADACTMEPVAVDLSTVDVLALNPAEFGKLAARTNVFDRFYGFGSSEKFVTQHRNIGCFDRKVLSLYRHFDQFY